MENKTRQKTDKSLFIQVIIILAVILSYTLLVLFMPSQSQLVLRSYAAVLLSAAAISDIRSNEIPFVICITLIITAMVYIVFFSFDIIVLIAGVLIMAILFVIRMTNRKVIGMGDVLLLGFSILMFSLDEILGFLFLTFFFSSISGIIISIKKRKLKDTIVPLVPCITIAFIIRTLLYYLQ